MIPIISRREKKESINKAIHYFQQHWATEDSLMVL